MKQPLHAFIFLCCSLGVISCKTARHQPPHTPPVPTAKENILKIPFTLHDNRILVRVTINGKGPFVMIFDTGSPNVITPRAQTVLQLPSQGFEISELTGEIKTDVESVHIKTFQAGSFLLQEQKFIVTNLDHIQRTFRFPQLDGVVGFEWMQKAKVRIDFDQQTLQLLDFDSPTLPNAQTVDFELHNQKSVIQGQIQGHPARLLIDTADRSNLTLFRKFAESSKLEERFARHRTIVTGMSVKGPIQGKLASINSVELGPLMVNDILARLPMTQKGYFFTNNISASVGLGLLREFNLEFDYKNKRLTMQRRLTYNETSTFVPVPGRVR